MLETVLTVLAQVAPPGQITNVLPSTCGRQGVTTVRLCTRCGRRPALIGRDTCGWCAEPAGARPSRWPAHQPVSREGATPTSRRTGLRWFR